MVRKPSGRMQETTPPIKRRLIYCQAHGLTFTYFILHKRPYFLYKNGGVNPRQPVDQDLTVSPNINALRATDPYLYKYYMPFFSKYQLLNSEKS